MAYLLIRHKVADYKKWKAVFDDASALRKAGGEKGGQVLHLEGDPNNLLMLFEWESLEKAHDYVQSEDLRKGMQEAGVVEQPEMYFLSEVERVPAP